MIYIGLDMSLSSSGICIQHSNKTDFYFFPQRKREINFNQKFSNDKGNFSFTALKEIPEFESREERYDYITEQIMNIILKYSKKDIISVAIEGYALAAQGQGVSMIFELGGVIRHKLFKNKIQFKEYSPTTIKKFFTGSGNANKFTMYQHFKFKTNLELNEIFNVTFGKSGEVKKPVEDLADSVAVCLIQQNIDYKPEEKLMNDILMEMF